MEKKYRIGEVVKNMGIGQYTLKHYEDKGLLLPHVDEQTGYRYYTFYEFGWLMHIRNLRNLEFSIDEICDIRDMSFSEFNASLKEKQKNLQEQIARLQETCRLLSQRSQHLERFLNCADSWEIRQSPAIPFLPHFEEEDLDADLLSVMKSNEWREAYENAELATMINLQALTGEEECRLTWGFVPYPSETSAALVGRCGQEIPAGERLDVFTCTTNKNFKSVVTSLKKALDESGRLPAGDAVCVVNAICGQYPFGTAAITASIPLLPV